MQTRVSAAASTRLADVLAAPARPAKVLASFRVATYLDGPDGVVAIVTPGAVRLPNAVLLTPADHATMGRHAGSPDAFATVGHGTVRLAEIEITVVRWWDPVPRLGSVDRPALGHALARLGDLLPSWPDRLDPAVSRLATGRDRLVEGLAGRAPLDDAAAALVGLGAGLTPAGDDLLAGAVAGLVIFGSAVEGGARRSARHAGEPSTPSTPSIPAALAAELADAVARRAGSTTRLAADLFTHAAAGAVAEPAAAVCRALSGAGPLAPAVERLLGIGHTSGRDLAEGLLIGGQAVIGRYGG